MAAPLFAAQKWLARTGGALSLTATPSGQAHLLVVAIRVSAVPITAENLTIVWHLGGVVGSAYSVELVREDLATEGVQNVVYLPESKLVVTRDDTIQVAYANSDGNTVAAQIVMEVGS